MDLAKMLKHRPKLAAAMMDVAKMKSTAESSKRVDPPSSSAMPLPAASADYDPPPPSRFWE